MRSSVAAVHDLVRSLTPGDEREVADQRSTLAWLAATDDVYRRVKPAVPPRHLVSYVLPVDPADGALLLVAHRNAGLWLPPGGHVEPDEHPALTAARELTEELGLPGTAAATEPVFLASNVTVGADAGHTDVGLWFVAATGRDTPLTPDPGEFTEVRWWSRGELAAADPALFDPHLGRFLAKAP